MKTLVFLTSLLLASAHAFTLNNSAGARFPNDEVQVHVSDQTCSRIGLSNSRLLELVGVAVDRFWNTVPTSRLTLRAGTLISTSADYQTDDLCSNSGSTCTPSSTFVHSNDIIIACNETSSNFSNSTSILAVATITNATGIDILGSVILLNDAIGTQLADSGEDELISTLAHEIGHAIGLGHSRFEYNLMHYASSSSRFYLGEDDVDGVTALYPAEQPFGSCGTIDFNDRVPPSPTPYALLLIGFLVALALTHLPKKKNLSL